MYLDCGAGKNISVLGQVLILPWVGDRGLILSPAPNPMEVHTVSLGLERSVFCRA